MDKMPADFWPDEVMVVGKYKGVELAFVLTNQDHLDGVAYNINAMRYSLWQAVNLPPHQRADSFYKGVPVRQESLAK